MNGDFGAVLVAAGGSSRMGGGRSKVLAELGGRPVLAWSLEALSASGRIGEIVIVCREEDRLEMEAAAQGCPVRVRLTAGGETRQQSVARGMAALSPEWKYVVVHDGARPLVGSELIRRVCQDAVIWGAATAAVPVKDTVKLGEDFVEETPPREKLFAVQTPQAFSRERYQAALAQARREGWECTDDCQLLERLGERVRLTPGSYRNLKLTTPEDLAVLRGMVEKQEGQAVRIGQGYDVHRLAGGRRLILAGVEIPFEKGLLGHSDADVITHAVCDAILGAAALGDIGHLFPDSDPAYEGADSLMLLKEVCRVTREAGYEIGNVDCTLLAQRPKIAPYLGRMRENLAAACSVEAGQVSVKATTEEGLGFTGTGEGMAAQAVALLCAK